MQYGLIKVPGSCGELVQGTIQGTDFLVSCPINIYSEVEVILNSQRELSLSSGGKKTLLAVEKTLEYLGVKQGGTIQVKNVLPIGKGMASSTADIAAACWATAVALGQKISPETVAEIALSIEPSDGIMFPGITLFDHRKGKIKRFLGFAPRLDILILDLGGEINTLSFNGRDDLDKLNEEKEPEVLKALDLIEKGIARQDISLLAQGSTLSALAHQKILPKPDLPDIIKQVQDLGALGVNIAHSGTVVGILVGPGKSDDPEFLMSIEEKLGKKLLGACKLVDGGKR